MCRDLALIAIFAQTITVVFADSVFNMAGAIQTNEAGLLVNAPRTGLVLIQASAEKLSTNSIWRHSRLPSAGGTLQGDSQHSVVISTKAQNRQLLQNHTLQRLQEDFANRDGVAFKMLGCSDRKPADHFKCIAKHLESGYGSVLRADLPISVYSGGERSGFIFKRLRPEQKVTGVPVDSSGRQMRSLPVCAANYTSDDFVEHWLKATGKGNGEGANNKSDTDAMEVECKYSDWEKALAAQKQLITSLAANWSTKTRHAGLNARCQYCFNEMIIGSSFLDDIEAVMYLNHTDNPDESERALHDAMEVAELVQGKYSIELPIVQLRVPQCETPPETLARNTHFARNSSKNVIFWPAPPTSLLRFRTKMEPRPRYIYSFSLGMGPPVVNPRALGSRIKLQYQDPFAIEVTPSLVFQIISFVLISSIMILISQLMQPNSERSYLLCSFVACMSFGIENFLLAYSGVYQEDSGAHVAVMFLMVLPITLAIHAFCRNSAQYRSDCSKLMSSSWSNWAYTLCAGLFIACAEVAGSISFNAAPNDSGALQAICVSNVLLVGLFFYWYANEKLTLFQLAGCALIVAGVLLTCLTSMSSGVTVDENSDLAFMWIIISTLCYTASIIALRITSDEMVPEHPKAVVILATIGVAGFACCTFGLEPDIIKSYCNSFSALKWPILNATASVLGMWSTICAYDVPQANVAVITSLIDSNSVVMTFFNYVLLGYVPAATNLAGSFIVLVGCSSLTLLNSDPFAGGVTEEETHEIEEGRKASKADTSSDVKSLAPP